MDPSGGGVDDAFTRWPGLKVDNMYLIHKWSGSAARCLGRVGGAMSASRKVQAPCRPDCPFREDPGPPRESIGVPGLGRASEWLPVPWTL